MADTHKAFGGASSFRAFGSITKVEDQPDGTIKVVGVASSGNEDSAGETITADAMKAAIPGYEKFPALREMHGLSAAGVTLDLMVDDDGITRIEAHVVDPIAILKVKTGVYKGFSIGGRALARDPADRTIITKLKLTEISLVDVPCNPDATLDMWKADGPTEGTDSMSETPAPWAPANKDVLAKAEALATEAGKPGRRNDYLTKARASLIADHAAGVEAEAAATAEVAKAEAEAVVEPVAEVVAEPVAEAAAEPEAEPAAEVDKAEVIAEPTPDPIAALEAAVTKANELTAEPVAAPVVESPVTVGLEDFAKGLTVIAAQPDTTITKGLYTVGWLARIMSELVCLQRDTVWESEAEGDASPVPAAIAAQVRGLGASLVAMAQEEVAEVLADLGDGVDLITPDVIVDADDFAYAEKVVDLVKADADLVEKAGKRNSKGDQAKLQAIHDNVMKLGAECPTMEKAQTPEDIAKADSAAAHAAEVVNKAAETILGLTATVDDLQKRLAAVEDSPAPAKAAVGVPPGLSLVNKADDVTGGLTVEGGVGSFTKAEIDDYVATLTPEELGQIQLRKALATPLTIRNR